MSKTTKFSTARKINVKRINKNKLPLIMAKFMDGGMTVSTSTDQTINLKLTRHC